MVVVVGGTRHIKPKKDKVNDGDAGDCKDETHENRAWQGG